MEDAVVLAESDDAVVATVTSELREIARLSPQQIAHAPS